MKTFANLFMLATLGTVAAQASILTITLDAPNQVAVPGETLQFFGTITNNDPSDAIFLNADSFTLDGLSFTVADLFDETVPFVLFPSGHTSDIELFDVTVSNPLLDSFGTYAGSYELIGGADGGNASAMDNLGQVSFSVTTVPPTSTPEPSTVYLLLAGGAAVVLPVVRRARRGR